MGTGRQATAQSGTRSGTQSNTQAGTQSGEYGVLALTGLAMCHLVARALHGERAASDFKPAAVTWESLFSLAKRNSIEAITWMALPEHPSEPIPQQIAAAWQQKADLTLFRQLTFDVAREALGAQLTARGISYMALKGVHTSAYYPQPGMRSMADNDILYGPIEPLPGADAHAGDGIGFRLRGSTEQERKASLASAERAVREIMNAGGYALNEEASGDLGYVKLPYLSFEMVQNVVMPRNDHYAYYRNPWRRTRPVDPQAFAAHGCGEMRWPIEDEYLFHLSHMFKHYDQFGGCGIRFAIDEQVFLGVMRERHADWQYVERELEALNLTQFERRVRRAALIAFGEESRRGELTVERIVNGDVRIGSGIAGEDSPSATTPSDMRFLFFLLTCGVYGNLKFQLEHELDKAKARKGSYLMSRIFPSRAFLVSTYPWLERRPWLLPVMPFYRLAHGLAHNAGKIGMELRMLLRRKR